MTSVAALLEAAPAINLKRPARVPTTELPLLHGRNYAKLIRTEILEVMRELVLEQLVPQIPFLLGQAATTDSLVTDIDPWVMTLTKIISDVKIQMARQVSDAELAELVRRRVVSGVMVANGELNRRQLKVLLGVDVLTGDDRLLGLVQGFLTENVALIKSIPEKYFDQVEGVVLENVRAGRRASAIEGEIERRFSVSATRATFIARDQTSKLNANITRQRHVDLGIEEYIWRTARDDRVRPDHRRLEGKKFRYDSPPIVDQKSGRRENPGGDYNCRCTAEPVIPGLDVEPQDLRRRLPPERAAAPTRPRAARPAKRRAPAAPAQPKRKPQRRAGPINDRMSLPEAEDAIRKKQVEHVAIYDSNGKLLDTGVGTKNSADITRKMRRAMQDRGDVSVIHNHPSGAPLSPPDIQTAIEFNARQIRATIPSGGAWVLERPKGGWGTSLPPKKLNELLIGVFKRAELRAARTVAERPEFKGVRLSGGKIADPKIRKKVMDAIREEGDKEITKSYNRWAKSRKLNWRITREG